jgi:farnesyl-diphosphate farnesyltransferase
MANQLIGSLLRSVSRSFYLSIRLLPSGLREPVGLAYLLARATDTLADTTEIPADIRKSQLETLAAAIQSNVAPARIEALGTSFAPLQSNKSERLLIESLPQCLEMLERTEAADREDIRVVLAKINRAQLLDIERFGASGNIRALSTAAELDDYTYLIAGCVGEFWTHMCVRHVRDFAELPVEEMLKLGRHYGNGLQLINILRDAGNDLRAGRCYFPNEDLMGLEPERILHQPEKLGPAFEKWLDHAESGLLAGMEYSFSIRNRRVRGATALPALIGARTIALLRQAGESALEQKVKVPRPEVNRMLRSVAMSLASTRKLGHLFRRALR